MSRQETAQACARAMWEADRASAGLGMVLEAVGPGSARMSMVVAPHMVNGHGTCHGGFVFALADSAFAFACNSHNQAAVGAHCTISYLRPARAGETLIATAVERVVEGRNGITDVTVTSEGAVIAEFRGQSRAIGRKVLPDAP